MSALLHLYKTTRAVALQGTRICAPLLDIVVSISKSHVKNSDMKDPVVCNINFYFYIRFVFGFYHEFQTSKPVRWLARCYCCLICASLIFTFHYTCNSNIYPLYLVFLMNIEYGLHISLSLLMTNKYLLQYYKKTPLIDASASTYRPVYVCLIGCMCLIFLVKVVSVVYSLNFYWGNSSYIWFSLVEFVIWCIIVLGKTPLLFVFALLYTRVRLMRQMLENNNFDCRNQGKHHPRRYIQMYETIIDGLQANDGSVKLQLLMTIVFSSTYYLFGIINDLHFLRYSEQYYDVAKFQLFWFLLEIMMFCLPLFMVCVLVDLVSMETQEMLFIILDKYIACKNERDGEEIPKLFQFLKSNPFEYSLWRVVPINVRSFLSFVSFIATTMIAILQIQHWTS